MNQRTMVKISAEKEVITLQTFSREYRSSQRFFVLRSKLEELNAKGKVIVDDIHSFAILRLCQTPGGLDVIDIKFSWLSDAGGRRLSGKEECVRLSYESFLTCIEESLQLGGQCRKLLSVPAGKKPKIEFSSRHHLKEVVSRKRLRRKLGKFLDQHFDWENAQSIFITDESEPYSFFFTEQTVQGIGICGGIILHGRDNIKNATYSSHT